MPPEKTTLKNKLYSFGLFLQKIKKSNSLLKKREIAASEPLVKEFLKKHNHINHLTTSWGEDYAFILHILILFDQADTLILQMSKIKNPGTQLKVLLEQLLSVEKHYAFMGGLAGYYETILKMIDEKQDQEENTSKIPLNCRLHRPYGADLTIENHETFSATQWGLENLPKMGLICPLGGAGDRLNLKDPTSEEDVPVAYLPLEGISLLEGLIRDLQAQEFLFWKIYGTQLTTPFAMMTSFEKNNDAHILKIFQKHQYFGRPQESYRRFIQPLVPVITQNGDLSFKEPLELTLKPGGHGLIWKQAIETGTFDWFEKQGIECLFVRQINNPIAATDFAFIAFAGIGCHHEKDFGFLSCERLPNTAEGMLVMKEVKKEHAIEYSISNIEYTDASQEAIEKHCHKKESSTFPTNTNILFVRLKGIESLTGKMPLPGMMINMKNKVTIYDDFGNQEEVYGGRLESMMQNISDAIIDRFQEESPKNLEKLHCYVSYGNRQKTISVTKNPVKADSPISETPIGAFFDLLANRYDLLTNRCQMSLPKMPLPEAFLNNGPSFIVRYHPALGPLYQVINQKIRGGALALHSELILEITEVDIENLNLDGSLRVVALDPLGHKNEQGVIQYSKKNGKCELKNVSIINKGINREAKNSYWEDIIEYNEKFEIILHGSAEFFAENVTLEMNQRIEVQDGERLEIKMKNGKVESRTQKIEKATWYWAYQFNDNKEIRLKKITD